MQIANEWTKREREIEREVTKSLTTNLKGPLIYVLKPKTHSFA